MGARKVGEEASLWELEGAGGMEEGGGREGGKETAKSPKRGFGGGSRGDGEKKEKIFFHPSKQAAQNLQTLKDGILSGRPVSMAPAENYDFLLKKVYSTSQVTRFLTKLGLNPSDWQQLGTTATSATIDFVKRQAKL
jgi:hypothetical protein